MEDAAPPVGEDFATWLRARRTHLLLSQEQLADRAGVGTRTVRDIEAGRARPRATTRRLLEEALDGAIGGAEVARPALLPSDVHAFTGRERELRALDGLLEEADAEPLALVISAVSGTAGVGKTALAVHWAHRVTERFPDGQLFVDLRGYGPDAPVDAAAALEGFLLDLGVPARDVPQGTERRLALYRSLLADRRMLVVLDNAATVDQVRPLLPGTGTCFVIVTSRDRLAGLVAREGARRLDLDLLPLPEARQLLRSLIGHRVDAEPEAAELIAERCGRLPLALRVTAELAAARAASTLAELLDELADEQRRLDVLDAGGDTRTAVRTVLSWSYRNLSEEAARTFRLLGLHPGRQWDAQAVAALTDRSPAAAQDQLEVLARAHLVAPARSGHRYRMHDLLHAYAASLAEAQEDPAARRAALTRLFDHYLAGACACMDAVFPEGREQRPRVMASTPAPALASAAAARSWLDTERPNLVAVAAHPAHRTWSRHAIDLSQVLWRYLFSGAHFRDAGILHGSALAAARASGDRAGEAAALRHLSTIAWRLGRYDEAGAHSTAALALYRELGDRHAESSALNTLGVILLSQGRYAEAIVQHRAAEAVAVAAGDRIAQGSINNNLGVLYARTGRYEDAVRHLEQALALRRQIGDRIGEGVTLGNLGWAQRGLGHADQARQHYWQALAVAVEVGERSDEAHALNGLGLLLQQEQRHADAAAFHRRALDIARETGNRPVEASALNGLAAAVLPGGDVQAALALHLEALTLAGDLGDRYEQARAQEGLARSLDAAGRHEDAARRWRDALAAYEQLDVPEAEQVRRHLDARGD